MRETLARWPTLRSTRLFNMQKERGFPGSPRTIREHVARLRPRREREAFLRTTPLIGEQSQIDWAFIQNVNVDGGQRPLWMFVIVLSWSRAMCGASCASRWTPLPLGAPWSAQPGPSTASRANGCSTIQRPSWSTASARPCASTRCFSRRRRRSGYSRGCAHRGGPTRRARSSAPFASSASAPSRRPLEHDRRVAHRELPDARHRAVGLPARCPHAPAGLELHTRPRTRAEELGEDPRAAEDSATPQRARFGATWRPSRCRGCLSVTMVSRRSSPNGYPHQKKMVPHESHRRDARDLPT
jgi:hypothetical protein